MEGKVYAPGERAQNGGHLYQCRTFPNANWCGLNANGAYAPGMGFAWMDAWTLVGACN
jgi:chitin-binding protein